MNIIIIGLLGIIFLFAIVVFFGAPYLPTLNKQADTFYEILNLKPNQTIIDLGCGGGKLLRLAAKNNLNAIGYELNPILFLIAWLTTRRRSVKIKVIFGNYWNIDLPKADAIFVFLLPRYMNKLDKKIEEYSFKPVILASFAFTIPGKKIIKEKDNIFIYKYQ